MSIYTGTNITVPKFFEILEGHQNEYAALAAELAAAGGNVDRARTEWLETTDDTEVVKLRAAIKAAEEKLAAKAAAAVAELNLSEDEATAKKEQLKELRTQIRKGRELIIEMAEQLSDDVEGVKAALENYPDVTRTGKVGRPAGSGAGGSALPRVSVDITVHGGALEGKTFEAFSFLAKALKTEVKDLQLAFASAAGVDHKDIADVKRPVEFKIQPVEDGPVYTVSTTPKQNKKPGPKAAA